MMNCEQLELESELMSRRRKYLSLWWW